MSLTNGKLITSDKWWTESSKWRLYGVTQSGYSVAMETPIYEGLAEDANKFAAEIAKVKGFKSWFLYDMKD